MKAMSSNCSINRLIDILYRWLPSSVQPETAHTYWSNTKQCAQTFKVQLNTLIHTNAWINTKEMHCAPSYLSSCLSYKQTLSYCFKWRDQTWPVLLTDKHLVCKWLNDSDFLLIPKHNCVRHLTDVFKSLLLWKQPAGHCLIQLYKV